MRIHAIAAFAIFSATAAQAAGDAQAGLRLAQKWCSSCHQVEENAAIKDFVPSFAALSRQKGADFDWARAWLLNPHPPMEGLNLTRAEIDDVIAYLRTLRTKE